MIPYLLKSGMLLLVFYAVYKFWLENEKMFRFNRVYLLLSIVFSLIVPLQLIYFESIASGRTLSAQLDELVIQKSNENIQSLVENLNLSKVIFAVYGIVVLLLVFRFLLNLHSFYKKIKRNETRFVNEEKIVLIEEPILPHSFWNTIFINKNEFKNGKIPSELIAHEKAHLIQKHTFDIVFIEVLQIIFWFNPVLLLFKKAIKLNHEFLADEAVNSQFGEVANYQNLLLAIASDKASIALASNINYLITKKRFIMMTKKKSPVKAVLKVFSIAVVSSLLFFVFSAKSTAQTDKSKIKAADGLSVGFDTTNVRQPEFPGGITEFYKFIGKNFKMPSEASKNKIEGKVNMRFTVEKDGSVTEVIVVKDLGYGLGEEANRVLRLSPKWIPASEKGKPVRVQYDLPITIATDK
ncbi:MAG: M56 family metallopeptidase [Flavobacterium sp.]